MWGKKRIVNRSLLLSPHTTFFFHFLFRLGIVGVAKPVVAQQKRTSSWSSCVYGTEKVLVVYIARVVSQSRLNNVERKKHNALLLLLCCLPICYTTVSMLMIIYEEGLNGIVLCSVYRKNIIVLLSYILYICNNNI